MKTIARNRTKLINEVFATATCIAFDYENGYSGVLVSTEVARKEYERFSSAKLFDLGDGKYRVKVDRRCWYNLDTNTRPAPVAQVVEEQPAAQEPLVVPAHGTVEQRRALGESRVTLDGEPALISGFRMAFATIQSNDQDVEFSWESVAHVVACGGNFFSNPDKARAARKPKSAREIRIAAIQDALGSADSATLAKIAELLKLT